MKKELLISTILTTLVLASSVSAQFNTTWTAFPYPNITSIGVIFTYNNTVTSGLFVTLLIFAMWIIVIMISSRVASIPSSLATSSIIATVLSVILRTNSLIGDSTIMIFIVLSAVGILLTFKSGGNY